MSAPMNTTEHGWLGRLVRHPLVDTPALSFYLEEINPLWSLTETRARVERVVDETHDTRSFHLKAGRGWNGFRAGQHVGIHVEIDGVRYQRRYSFSCAESAGNRFRITVKRVPGGRVSNWLHDHVKAGDVITVSPASGDFVLDQEVPKKLLLLSAGSGITPVASLLHTLLEGGYDGNIRFVHYARTSRDLILGDELRELARNHPNLEITNLCADEGEQGQISAGAISKLVPDFGERLTYLCGPAGFMEIAREIWQKSGSSDHLRFEYFGSPTVRIENDGNGVDATVRLAKQQASVNAAAGSTLLEALEEAGQEPKYGCRIGICQSCRCRKNSGVVRNLVTGEVSAEPQQEIQLCISAAESEVELEF